MKPKIVLVDNELENIRNFQGAFDDLFDIVAAEIKNDLKEMGEYLLNINADGYVLDYKLTDTLPEVRYNGAELYNFIHESKHEIPLIILTGQEDKMTQTIYDPYHIVSKSELDNAKQFGKKLLQLVMDYKNKYSDADKRLKELVEKKSNSRLSLKEYEELVDLDSYLDQVIYKRSVVPASVKKSDVSERLDVMLEKTDYILKQLKK